jgi:hypothetical protein
LAGRPLILRITAWWCESALRANRQHRAGCVGKNMVCHRHRQMRRTHKAFCIPDAEDDQIGLFLLGYLEDFLCRYALPHDCFGFTTQFRVASHEGAQAMQCRRLQLVRANKLSSLRMFDHMKEREVGLIFLR